MNPKDNDCSRQRNIASPTPSLMTQLRQTSTVGDSSKQNHNSSNNSSDNNSSDDNSNSTNNTLVLASWPSMAACLKSPSSALAGIPIEAKLQTISSRINGLKKVHVCVLVALTLLSFCVSNSEARRSRGICRSIPCANGGTLVADPSIWSNCICICPRGFAGPYCQDRLSVKRSPNIRNRRVSRSETLDRIRLRLARTPRRPSRRRNMSTYVSTSTQQDAAPNRGRRGFFLDSLRR